jgi:hypothetical protein
MSVFVTTPCSAPSSPVTQQQLFAFATAQQPHRFGDQILRRDSRHVAIGDIAHAHQFPFLRRDHAQLPQRQHPDCALAVERGERRVLSTGRDAAGEGPQVGFGLYADDLAV